MVERCLRVNPSPRLGFNVCECVNLSLCAGRFWHITDLHLDPTYHRSTDPTKVCFSSKGVPVTQAGLFGDFLCDSPYSLIQSALAHMAPLTQPLDFIVWTGSVPELNTSSSSVQGLKAVWVEQLEGSLC